ncbi:MAG: nitronate monooxygenase [Deltaproteobacteria bacterium]|nr:nitronate monooxygenase [Deltaproteobacteria bacterium]
MGNKPIHTKLCDLLGIEYPIIEGGMVWISEAILAAAVSNAGGLGQIAAGSFLNAADLRKEIRKAKDLTEKPFAINVPLLNPGAVWMIETALEEKVKVITTSAGNPSRFSQKIKDSGTLLLHVVPSVRLARKADAAGVDAIVAEGIEAGGHDSPDEITSLVLIPQVVDAVKVPVVAAGGIADGRGLAAALALGASGVQMGTRFVVTKECQVHPNFKRAIIEAQDNGTVLTARSLGQPVRVLKNSLAEKILELERKGVSESELMDFIGPGRTRNAALKGDLVEGSVMSGQIAGMIKEESSVKDVIQEMVWGAEEILRKLSKDS